MKSIFLVRPSAKSRSYNPAACATADVACLPRVASFLSQGRSSARHALTDYMCSGVDYGGYVLKMSKVPRRLGRQKIFFDLHDD